MNLLEPLFIIGSWNTQAIVFGARDIVGSSIYYFVSKFYRQLVLRDKKQSWWKYEL